MRKSTNEGPRMDQGGEPATARTAAGSQKRLEAQRDAARKFELVGVLGVSDDVAAPVRIAPPAALIRLDVGRRELERAAEADVLGGKHFDAAAPGGRELRFAANRSVDAGD